MIHRSSNHEPNTQANPGKCEQMIHRSSNHEPNTQANPGKCEQVQITNRAMSIVDGLSALNRRLSEARGKLFGDEDGSVPEGSDRPAPPLEISLQQAFRELETAHDQMSGILNRL
jgi:hypothetical protein